MESYSPSLSEEGLSVEWRKHGNVIIKINENPFLFFLEHEKNGFTKSIATNGGYGNTWNEMEYQKKIYIRRRLTI